jgi:hypothetical protein
MIDEIDETRHEFLMKEEMARIEPFEALWTSIQPNKICYLFLMVY